MVAKCAKCIMCLQCFGLSNGLKHAHPQMPHVHMQERCNSENTSPVESMLQYMCLLNYATDYSLCLSRWDWSQQAVGYFVMALLYWRGRKCVVLQVLWDCNSYLSEPKEKGDGTCRDLRCEGCKHYTVSECAKRREHFLLLCSDKIHCLDFGSVLVLLKLIGLL